MSLEDMQAQTAIYQENQGFEFATFHDYSWQARMHLAKQAGLNDFGFPTNVLLDREGKIIGFWAGYSPVVVNEIDQVLRDELAK